MPLRCALGHASAVMGVRSQDSRRESLMIVDRSSNIGDRSIPIHDLQIGFYYHRGSSDRVPEP